MQDECSQTDAEQFAAELREIDRDLQDGDLRQAEMRLFDLISAVLLDPSDFADNNDLYATALQLGKERSCFQEPICQSYLLFRTTWIQTSRRAFQAAWKKSQGQWTPSCEHLIEQQLQAVSEALQSDDDDRRLLAVRELMRLVQDTDALEHLRQARQALERYRSSLLAKQEECHASKKPPEPETIVPPWQQQIDEEFAVHLYYAERIQTIEQDPKWSPAIKAPMLERLYELRDQAHFELMQPPEEGGEPCVPVCDDDPLPDNVRSLEAHVGGHRQ